VVIANNLLAAICIWGEVCIVALGFEMTIVNGQIKQGKPDLGALDEFC